MPHWIQHLNENHSMKEHPPHVNALDLHCLDGCQFKAEWSFPHVGVCEKLVGTRMVDHSLAFVLGANLFDRTFHMRLPKLKLQCDLYAWSLPFQHLKRQIRDYRIQFIQPSDISWTPIVLQIVIAHWGLFCWVFCMRTFPNTCWSVS